MAIYTGEITHPPRGAGSSVPSMLTATDIREFQQLIQKHRCAAHGHRGLEPRDRARRAISHAHRPPTRRPGHAASR